MFNSIFPKIVPFLR